MTTDDDQRIAALMMAAGGLKPRDIAQALGVHEKQVEHWLKESSTLSRRDEQREKEWTD